jgi:hypothetical protein
MKENAALSGIGLNPNLNIEDEYIENLLKQIHFMNMEIKLLKEKHAASDGNALWGILNRTNQPVVQNIVESAQKYQSMKKTADTALYVPPTIRRNSKRTSRGWPTTTAHSLTKPTSSKPKRRRFC